MIQLSREHENLAASYHDGCLIATLESYLLDRKEFERLKAYRNEDISWKTFEAIINWAITERLKHGQR